MLAWSAARPFGPKTVLTLRGQDVPLTVEEDAAQRSFIVHVAGQAVAAYFPRRGDDANGVFGVPAVDDAFETAEGHVDLPKRGWLRRWSASYWRWIERGLNVQGGG